MFLYVFNWFLFKPSANAASCYVCMSTSALMPTSFEYVRQYFELFTINSITVLISCSFQAYIITDRAKTCRTVCLLSACYLPFSVYVCFFLIKNYFFSPDTEKETCMCVCSWGFDSFAYFWLDRIVCVCIRVPRFIVSQTHNVKINWNMQKS